MNHTEKTQAVEFQRLYAETKQPVLPDRLSQYRFVSCLSDGDRKKAWILKKDNGQKILCKFATGEYMDMLRTESACFSLGKFPFVPYIFDYFETEEGAYLLREYIEGETLNETIEKSGPLPLPEAISLMKQVCDMLFQFHSCNPPVIYRDLKPSNIVCHPSGDCYLIDIGTVRTYHEDGSSDTVFMGTPDTAAPEQFGARQTDNRTDIYSIGILFYYLLTGELKIQNSSMGKLPRRAAAIIKKCISFDPENRYADIGQVQSALLSLLPDKKQKRTRIFGCISAAMFLVSLCLFFLPLLSPSSKAITFSSPLLEQAIREELGKTNGEPVYEEDLSQITQILICGDTVFHNASEHYECQTYHTINGVHHGYGDITDISLLAKMPNLSVLVLDYQKIYDITPLKGLPLATLSLSGSPIRDLTALENCNSLNSLYIGETAVISLEPLSTCNVLMLLDCTESSVVSLAPIEKLSIHHLFIGNIPAADLDVLASLPLEELACSHLPVESLDDIRRISSLKILTLQSCGILSLTELSGFDRLIELHILDNQISSLDGLENFPLLMSINLSENPITDFSALPKAASLTSLTLPNGKIDYTFLFDMPQLKTLIIQEQQKSLLYETIPEPWFEIRVL